MHIKIILLESSHVFEDTEKAQNVSLEKGFRYITIRNFCGFMIHEAFLTRAK